MHTANTLSAQCDLREDRYADFARTLGRRPQVSDGYRRGKTDIRVKLSRSENAVITALVIAVLVCGIAAIIAAVAATWR